MAAKSRIHITGGEARGFAIPSPRGANVRPTPSKVRQAIFNMLYDRTRGARVLELFAGVGTLGIEALSRGASFATFVEMDRNASDSIRTTLQRLGWTDRGEVLRGNAFRAADLLATRDSPYSLIFLDPPYDQSRSINPRTRLHRLIEELGCSPVVEDGALLFLQHPRHTKLDCQWTMVEIRETRPYGSTAITIMRKQIAQDVQEDVAEPGEGEGLPRDSE